MKTLNVANSKENFVSYNCHKGLPSLLIDLGHGVFIKNLNSTWDNIIHFIPLHGAQGAMLEP